MGAGAVGRVVGLGAGAVDNVASVADDIAKAATNAGMSVDDAVADTILARHLTPTRLHEKTLVIGDDIARSEPFEGSGLSEYFLSHADDGVGESILAGHRSIMERFTAQFGSGTSNALADAGRAAHAATDGAAGVAHTKTIVIDDAAREILEGYRASPNVGRANELLDGPILGQDAFREQFAEAFRRQIADLIVDNIRP